LARSATAGERSSEEGRKDEAWLKETAGGEEFAASDADGGGEGEATAAEAAKGWWGWTRRWSVGDSDEKPAALAAASASGGADDGEGCGDDDDDDAYIFQSEEEEERGEEQGEDGLVPFLERVPLPPWLRYHVDRAWGGRGDGGEGEEDRLIREAAGESRGADVGGAERDEVAGAPLLAVAADANPDDADADAEEVSEGGVTTRSVRAAVAGANATDATVHDGSGSVSKTGRLGAIHEDVDSAPRRTSKARPIA
jgi:hypothetical protein